MATTPGGNDAAVISSAANPAIALVRSLGRRDRRAAERAFVVEGMRAVADALEAGAAPRLVLLRQGDDARAAELPFPAGVRPRLVERRLFDRLSEVQAPQGVLAVFPIPDVRPDPSVAAPLVLVVDRLRDPGNLGTLLRAAAGAGAHAAYLSPETVDPWNAKVVRAGMGAHFRLSLPPLDDAALRELQDRVPLRVVARADAPLAYDAVDWTGPSVLIVGGEAEGVSERLSDWSSEAVRIPLAAGVESLNAAVAGSVILFEAARQRRLKDEGRGG